MIKVFKEDLKELFNSKDFLNVSYIGVLFSIFDFIRYMIFEQVSHFSYFEVILLVVFSGLILMASAFFYDKLKSNFAAFFSIAIIILISEYSSYLILIGILIYIIVLLIKGRNNGVGKRFFKKIKGR